MVLIPSSSHSPVVGAYTDLTAAQIAALNGAPVTVVPAITGRTIVPVGAVFAYTPGTVAFGTDRTLQIIVGGIAVLAFDGLLLNGLVATRIVGQVQGSAPVVVSTALELTAISNPGGAGPILASALDGAGHDFVPTDTATVVQTGGTGGLITVSTVLKQFAIASLVQGAKTFTITGDASAVITAGTGLKIIRSTGNDGSYTVVSSVFGAGSTVITVNEAISSATANGKAEPDDGTGGAIATYALTNAGTGYHAGSAGLTAVGPSVGAGAELTISSVTSQSDGTGRLTVFYAVV